MIRRLVIPFVFFFALFTAVSVHAQTASITGTVTDSSGALVPGAKVTAEETATGAVRTIGTDESGTYLITFLAPGPYDVRIEKAGFKSVVFSDIQLTVDQVLTLDAALVPSSLNEKITVNGDKVAPINLTDAQVSQAVDSQQIHDLPLLLRDPYTLMQLSPGVVQSNSLFGGFSVNGGSERNNNFMLDGADNNDSDLAGFPAGQSTLNPDATQEFRIITNNYLPEFGRNNGSIVDIITRSGTNQFHSDIYWFGRYDELGARDYFNHNVLANGQEEPRNPYSRNDFGGSAGGAILRKQLFWFANYEGQRFDTTRSVSTIVPTPQFVAGNFTVTETNCPYTTHSCTATVNLIDPTSPNYANGIFNFPLDPLMQQIFSHYPAPNGPAVDSVRGYYFFPSVSHTTGDNVTVRLDHNFSNKQMLTARYIFNRLEDPNQYHTDFLPGLGATGTVERRQNLALHLTSIIKQTHTNELRFGGNRINFPQICGGTSVFDSIGPTDPYGRGRDYDLPGLYGPNGTNGFGCVFLGDTSASQRFSGTYTAGDTFAWVSGRHTVKTGIEFRDVYSNSYANYASRTTMDFSDYSNSGFQLPAFATGNPNVDSDVLLQNMVWSLFGVPDQQVQAQFFGKSGTRAANNERGIRQHEFNGFVQDTYKVFPNLTVTYGFRYEFNGVPYEVNNLLSTLLVPPDGPAPFTFTTVGKSGGTSRLYDNDWTGVEPRIAFAWDPFRKGRTSIRAGYGIFHDRVFGQLINMTAEDPPYQQICTQVFINTSPNCPAVTLVPMSYVQLPGNANFTATVQDGQGILPFLLDRNMELPYSQNWNFGIQQEFFHNLVIETDYVGSKGTRLLRLVDGNPPQPALVTQLAQSLINGGVPAQEAYAELQFSCLWFGSACGLPSNAVGNDAFYQADVFNNAAFSTYNAFQANVTKRLSYGFTLNGSYTFSHSIDDASDPLVPTQGNQSFPRDSLDLRAERGNSDTDVTQRLVMNYTWDLPYGRGHEHYGTGFFGRALGNWQIAGITVFSSGLPFDIFTNIDAQHTGLDSRPDYNPSGTLVPVISPRTQTGPNVGLFSIPNFVCSPCAGGDVGRNHFRGPGVNNWDMVVSKSFLIYDRLALDVRTEFYNMFNRVQFGQPDSMIQDGRAFGQSTSQVGRPDGTTGARQIQFAVKLHF
jgi:hypothetical protein